ncbi:MAG: hypothetical protein LBR47_05085 [Spirochaetaceae bacterium]|nr:hypothetical protein [Spirochaetaceae bacterium]
MKVHWALWILSLVFLETTVAAADTTYPNMVTRSYDGGTTYEFRNNNSDTLLIQLEDTGLNSVLGIKQGNKWKQVNSACFLVKWMADRYSLLVPEKLNMKSGRDYRTNRKMKEAYTLDNLVRSYAASINGYLEANTYNEVILIGLGEGGSILPLVYERLEHKNIISGLVSVGSGGFSRYDQIRILGSSGVPLPEAYRSQCLLVDTLREDIAKNPDSVTKEYLGLTYRWWSSFGDYLPAVGYAAMDKPVMFIQDTDFWLSPLESAEYIEESHPRQLFKFVYRGNDGNNRDSVDSFKSIYDDVERWLETIRIMRIQRDS